MYGFPGRAWEPDVARIEAISRDQHLGFPEGVFESSNDRQDAGPTARWRLLGVCPASVNGHAQKSLLTVERR
jgi:hypothetical protein